MKNFNFAFFFTLYLVINGSVYLKSTDRNFFFISLIVTLPLLFVAVNNVLRKPDKEIDPEKDFNILNESLIPYITALITSTVFAYYVYKMVNDPSRPMLFFVAPRLAGWGWIDGIVIGILILMLSASGMGIWSSQMRQKLIESGNIREKPTYYVFLLGLPPGVRLIAYFLILTILAAAGFAAVYLVFGESRSNDWSGLVVVTGRCLLPMAALVLAALLRFPISPFAIAAIGGTGYLFAYNTSYIEGATFAGSQIVLAGIYAVATISLTRARRNGASHSQKIEPEPESRKISDDSANSPRIQEENQETEENKLENQENKDD